jgi:hypothetical protein
VDDRPDPERELLASFKQARVVIDELERQQTALLFDDEHEAEADEAEADETEPTTSQE